MKKTIKARIRAERRPSKKEIYARYGIEYKSGKINAPVFGWIRPLLCNGNSKLGKSVFTWSTLPTNNSYHVAIDGEHYDISGTCPCHCSGCYATHGCYCFPSVIASLAKKTVLAQQFMDFVERAIMAQIEADNIQLLRIHASGDFFSVEYVEMWKRIVRAFPSCLFWTYTKFAPAVGCFDGFANANCVKSVIDCVGLNFGKCDYILKAYQYLLSLGKSVWICKCGVDANQHCVNCTGCAKHEYVLFLEHSTSYKPEEDASFPKFSEVVNAQQTA